MAQKWYRVNLSPGLPYVSFLTENIIAQTDIPGVWVTTNKGESWNMTLTTHNVLSAVTTDKFYALGGMGKAFIHRYDPLSNTWTNLATDTIAEPFVTKLCFRSSGECFSIGEFFGGTNPRLYRSTNNGLSWRAVPEANLPQLSNLYAAPAPYLFATSWNSGFYRSADDGLTWTGSSWGLPSLRILAYTYINLSRLLIVSDSGLYSSSDQGRNWLNAASGFTVPVKIAAMTRASNGDLYAASVVNSLTTVFRSTNAGESWNQHANQVMWGNVEYIAASPSGNLLVSTEYGGLYTNDSSFANTYPVSLKFEKQMRQNSILSVEYCYPNPFNPTTNIAFKLHDRSDVCIELFDVLGKRLISQNISSVPAGEHTKTLSADGLAAGVYYLRIRAGLYSDSQKLIIQK